MFTNKSVSIIIPCYNEESGIRRMLAHIPAFVDQVIVVDNNSTDGTAEAARACGAVTILETKKGYGAACQAGFAAATGDVLIMLDGDDSYALADAEKLLRHLTDHDQDLVIGCRFPLERKDAQPFINTMANALISGFIRILFKISLKDSQSGMMAFKRSLLEEIGKCGNGFNFSQEIKIRAMLRRDIRCGETHISYRPRVGEVKITTSDALRNLCLLFPLWVRLREAERETRMARSR